MKASEFIFHGVLMTFAKGFSNYCFAVFCLQCTEFAHTQTHTFHGERTAWRYLPRPKSRMSLFEKEWPFVRNIFFYLNGPRSNVLFSPFLSVVCIVIRKNRFTFYTNVSLYLNCMLWRNSIEIYCLKHKQWMKISRKKKWEQRWDTAIR